MKETRTNTAASKWKTYPGRFWREVNKDYSSAFWETVRAVSIKLAAVMIIFLLWRLLQGGA